MRQRDSEVISLMKTLTKKSGISYAKKQKELEKIPDCLRCKIRFRCRAEDDPAVSPVCRGCVQVGKDPESCSFCVEGSLYLCRACVGCVMDKTLPGCKFVEI